MTDLQLAELLETIGSLDIDLQWCYNHSQSRTNRSRIPDARLRKLEKFVFSRTRYGRNTRLKIDVYDGDTTIGFAHRDFDRIEIFVPQGKDRRNAAYPKFDEHRRMSGCVSWWSFEEEYLYVLAHEARHIDQNHAKRVRYPEVDAEAFAQWVLAEYRDEPFESVAELYENQKRIYPKNLIWRHD